MLRTKCIILPIEPDDGLRISIMSRHTLNDGVTPHPEITHSQYDEWWPALAPEPSLIGDYFKRGLSFDIFAERYLESLTKPDKREAVAMLIALAEHQSVTILCQETEPDHCHRRLLAEFCQKIAPNLLVHIR
jgi:uncharacterized protein YeaO (DUF488 family)